MHDDIKKSATIEALPTIIEKLIYYGYKFDTLTTNKKLIKHVKLT